MINIRRLSKSTDKKLYKTIAGWVDEAPDWRRASEGVFTAPHHTTYNSNDDRSFEVGIFAGDKIIAAIGFVLLGKGTWEVHLDAERHTDPRVIISAGLDIRDQMLGYGLITAFIWIVRQNRVVRRIAEAIGFRPDHCTLFRGQHRGSPIEWVRYSLTRSDFTEVT